MKSDSYIFTIFTIFTLGLLLAAISIPAHAQSVVLNGTGLKLSGFACIVGGKVINGSHPTRRTHLAGSYAHADGSPNGLHASLHGFGTLGYVSLDESDRAFVRDGTQARRWRR